MTARPNIVQIVADDMGYGDFGCFGDGAVTPAVDRLVSEGVCLTQHYTASPVCNPSRASLLTGRYPHRTGSIDTLEWRGLDRLALRETTLADMLQRAGYTTGQVGKWHLGAFDPRYHPQRRGFDEAVCFRGGMHDYYDWRLEFGEAVHRADGRYLTDVWTEEACGFIDRHANDEPFFLHVTYNAPHTPLQCPDEEVAPFAETGRFTDEVCMLYGMIRRMDRGIERILDALAAKGLADNTLVMFTSDNGPQLGGPFDRFNCGWRGSKGNTYEGGVRVPAVLRWPGTLAAGGAIDDMVHFVDWLPTLLSAAGAERPTTAPPLDGVDVWPALLGESGKTCTRRFWQWNRYAPLATCNAAMRDGDWKLVRPEIPEAMAVPDIEWLETSMYQPEHFIEHGIIREGNPPRTVPAPPAAQLYNIADDPQEQHDLAEADPTRAHRMLRELDTWFEQVEADRATISD